MSFVFSAMTRSCSQAPSFNKLSCTTHQVNIMSATVCLCNTEYCNGIQVKNTTFSSSFSSSSSSSQSSNLMPGGGGSTSHQDFVNSLMGNANNENSNMFSQTHLPSSHLLDGRRHSIMNSASIMSNRFININIIILTVLTTIL